MSSFLFIYLAHIGWVLTVDQVLPVPAPAAHVLAQEIEEEMVGE